MRDNNGTGVFKRKSVSEGAKDEHLSHCIIFTENAMKVSLLMQDVKFSN